MHAPPPGPSPTGAHPRWGRCGDYQICGHPCPLAADTTVRAVFSRSVVTYRACAGHAPRLAAGLRELGAHTVEVTTPTDR
jgi:hypothetical protein